LLQEYSYNKVNKVDALSYKTVFANKQSVQKEWYIVDAKDKVLGRVCSEVAKIIRGKHKPSYTPNTDCGDHVIVINAEKVMLTGRKWDQKEYVRHTGYPGGQRFAKAKDIRSRIPSRLIEEAVRGMLPKSRMGRKVFNNLHVYAGDAHPHAAQQPKELAL
jgi:large subunit ribosomal protein L13